MSLEGIRFQLLGPPVDPRFVEMTFPSFRPLLALETTRRHEEHGGPKRLVQPFAIAAFRDDTPVALLMGEAPLEGGDAEILSIFVVPEERRRGLATALVTLAEREVVRRGLSAVRAVYMTGKAGAEAAEHIFARREWDAPVTRMVTIQCRIEEWARAPWLSAFKLNPEYVFIPWSDVTEEDLEAIRRSQEETHWIPEDLVPWKYLHNLEPVSSLAVRYRGEIVAWVLNHPISRETVRFTCSYIRKDLGRLGRGLAVFAESVRRMQTTDYVNGIFTTPVHHKEMAALVRNWATKSSFFFGETRGVRKALS